MLWEGPYASDPQMFHLRCETIGRPYYSKRQMYMQGEEQGIVLDDDVRVVLVMNAT